MKDLPLSKNNKIVIVINRKPSLSTLQNEVHALVSLQARDSTLSLQSPLHIPSAQGLQSTAVDRIQSSLNSPTISRPAAPCQVEEFCETCPSSAYLGSPSTKVSIGAKAPRSCGEIDDKAVFDLTMNSWRKKYDPDVHDLTIPHERDRAYTYFLCTSVTAIRVKKRAESEVEQC